MEIYPSTDYFPLLILLPVFLNIESYYVGTSAVVGFSLLFRGFRKGEGGISWICYYGTTSGSSSEGRPLRFSLTSRFSRK